MTDLSYGPVEVYFGEILGSGAYGKVCRAKCGQLPCAAKILHSSLFSSNDPGANSLLKKFEQEYQFLSSIKHPNIIQCLGTTTESGMSASRMPILLMELMEMSLTDLLEQSKFLLPYHLQISICHDVTLALAYLHTNSIIHRDLSSNNVLVTGSKAKVADFGMSKIFDENLSYLSECPGNRVYMSPEALTKPPYYTFKLDCFSFGVLIIQIGTRRFPNPGPMSIVVADNKYPTGRIQVFVPEINRRKQDIDQLKPDHPLLPMALNCLKDKDIERPSADDLCKQLVSLVKAYHKEGRDIDDCLLMRNSRLEMELKEKTRTYKEKIDMIESANVQPMPRDQGKSINISKWTSLPPSPESLTTYTGTAVVNGKRAFFSQGSKIYCYKEGKTGRNGKWFELLDCPYQNCGLAVVNEQLTSISGRTTLGFTKVLLTLTGMDNHSENELRWKEMLPQIPTGREAPASLSSSSYLIVVGGATSFLNLNSCYVEVLDLNSFHWSTATNIPTSVKSPHIVQNRNVFYLLSYENECLYTCKVDDLFKSINETSATKKMSWSLWSKLQDVPVSRGASFVTVQGNLLVVGGESKDGASHGLVYCYSKETNWCFVIGKLPTARKMALTVVLPDDRIMCVGGRSKGFSEFLNIVEVGQVKCNKISTNSSS